MFQIYQAHSTNGKTFISNYNMTDNISAKHKIIVFGDLNSRIGNDVISNIKEKYNQATVNENVEILMDFCARNETRINNTYFPHKD